MSSTPDMTDPTDVLARTIWGEARGEGRPGMEAVAAVILNRARNPRWWGHDIVSVCLEPEQFSSWNPGDPNLEKLRTVTGADAAFVTASLVAGNAVDGSLADPTAGADSYFARTSPAPGWATRARWTRNIGHHAFYRVELPAPSGRPDAPCIRAMTADDLNASELADLLGDT